MLINEIKHSYQNFDFEIHNINLKENTIIGIVGENGAGKSTFMYLLSGFMKANNTFQVTNFEDKSILFIPSELDSYEYLTVEEFLYFINKYSSTNVPIADILKKLELEEKDVLIGELSQGMRKKITLVPLFINKYDLIILDEPFNSIDLNYIYKLKCHLYNIKSKSTILISSHILDTLADICDRFLLIESGHLKKDFINNKNIQNLEREIFDKDIKI